MSEDNFSNIINNFKSILNKNTSNDNSTNSDSNSSDSSSPSSNLNITPEMISNLANMLKNSDGFNSNSTNNSSSEDNFSDNFANNFDFETILKIKSIMENLNRKDDPRSKLLYSLKPYLRKSRQKKIDQYVNLFKIAQVSNLFKNDKGDKT